MRIYVLYDYSGALEKTSLLYMLLKHSQRKAILQTLAFRCPGFLALLQQMPEHTFISLVEVTGAHGSSHALFHQSKSYFSCCSFKCNTQCLLLPNFVFECWLEWKRWYLKSCGRGKWSSGHHEIVTFNISVVPLYEEEEGWERMCSFTFGQMEVQNLGDN